uniref:Aldehyde oxidase/xanthine dehydrogenase second molybdopterin binding domain-containing protein n=1 Tax=Craspedostauros australis TaxID=1486917 RepID=A0A7R9WZV2_9STRA|mmetsp:Transcript_3064/g.8327  ORF Transcript_3064/g.8327 Transcript_3064/m.8327 type:complete len:258 (+) Transcript_3064:514-1287(+)
MERIDLSAHGFFTLDDARCGYDFTKPKPDGVKVAPAATAVTEADGVPENSWKGQPFNYFTQGVAFSQVEIDVLTGNHKTIRSDCLVDVGSSINPSIDIGQIEGAFIQGMGWSTMEEVVYADDDHTWVRPRARMFTTGPGTYKIPAFNDVPETFNVSLQQDVDNPFAVHSSKAVGEPPFFLGSSVFYAIKDAVQSARRSFGNAGYFEMRMPATSERIRLHCCDAIARAAIDKACSGAGGSSESAESGGAETYQPQGSY